MPPSPKLRFNTVSPFPNERKRVPVSWSARHPFPCKPLPLITLGTQKVHFGADLTGEVFPVYCHLHEGLSSISATRHVVDRFRASNSQLREMGLRATPSDGLCQPKGPTRMAVSLAPAYSHFSSVVPDRKLRPPPFFQGNPSDAREIAPRLCLKPLRGSHVQATWVEAITH